MNRDSVTPKFMGLKKQYDLYIVRTGNEDKSETEIWLFFIVRYILMDQLALHVEMSYWFDAGMES